MYVRNTKVHSSAGPVSMQCTHDILSLTFRLHVMWLGKTDPLLVGVVADGTQEVCADIVGLLSCYKEMRTDN
jgi:hypothetical protein